MNTITAYEHPYVTTDATVFSIKNLDPESYRKLPTPKLMIMLYQRNNEPFLKKWSLPGGFLNIDELPEDNIKRKLSLKVQVESCYLEQLYTFCDINRDPRYRVISIVYLGLMNEKNALSLEKNQWFEIHEDNNEIKFINKNTVLNSSDIAFDHYEMIKKGIERLRSKILYTNIIFNLLPEEFTLTELQNTYETILGKKDTAANFRRKISHLVKETNNYTSDMGHRPAKLFTMR